MARASNREEQLLGLVKRAPIVLFAIDNDGIVTLSEGRGLEALGVDAGATVGRSAWDLYANHPAALALLRDALQGRRLTGTVEVAGAAFEVYFAPNYSRGKRIGIFGVAVNVTQPLRAERALLDSEARKGALLESALDAIVGMDGEGRIIEFNPAAERLFGYARGEALGRPLAEVMIPARLREQHRSGLAHYLATGDGPMLGKRIEMPALRSDGSVFLAELTVIPLSVGGPPTFTGFVRDITDRRRAEELRQQLAAIVESSDDAIIAKTAEGTILTWNRGAERLYGYTAEEAIGRPITMHVPPERRQEILDILERVKDGESVEHYETVRLRKDGVRIDVSLTVSPLRDEGGRIVGASAIARDISERKNIEERIKHLAFHDTLTGLPNRLLFNDRLEVAIAHARRNDQRLAVLFIDLDRFKLVNDSLGHMIGDALLRAVAERLVGCVREDDTVARLGGDEFLVLLPGVAAEEDATGVGRKILEAIRRPLGIQSHELSITTSIGIALYPADGRDTESLIRNADRAMYSAKEQGRDNCQMYQATMSGMPSERLRLES